MHDLKEKCSASLTKLKLLMSKSSFSRCFRLYVMNKSGAIAQYCTKLLYWLWWIFSSTTWHFKSVLYFNSWMEQSPVDLRNQWLLMLQNITLSSFCFYEENVIIFPSDTKPYGFYYCILCISLPVRCTELFFLHLCHPKKLFSELFY